MARAPRYHASQPGKQSPAVLLAGIIVAAALIAGPAAQACGYHSPQALARGMLNNVFPNSLYIRTAVWQAEDAGLLPPRDRSPARDMFSYQKAAADLQKLGGRISDAAADNDTLVTFAMVFVETALWTRFVATPDGYVVETHVDGPRPDELVMATDAKVVRALVNGSLDAATAQTHGLVRFYRQPALHDRLRAALMSAAAPKRQTMVR